MTEKYDKGFIPCNEAVTKCDLDMAESIAHGSYSAAFVGPSEYIFDKSIFKFMSKRTLICPMTYFEVPIRSQHLSYGLKKNTPYKKNIDLAMLRLQETGLLKKIRHDWYPQPPDCLNIQESTYKVVSIHFVYTAYFVLLGGYFISGFLLMIEILKSDSRIHK